MSEANKVSLKYIAEATYGTTPPSGVWQALRYTSQTLSANPRTVVSNEISTTRQVSDLIQVGQEVGGEFAFEFSDNTYDAFLEGAMNAAWATNVLKVGVDATKNQFSFEAGYSDWTTPQYVVIKGARVATLGLNFTYGQVVTGTCRVLGNGSSTGTTSAVGAGSTTAATTTSVMNASSGISLIKVDNSAVTGLVVKSIQLNIDNSLRPIEGIGAIAPSGVSAGRCMITGTIETYFDQMTLYTKLLNNTTAELDWTVGDGTNTYQFNLPKVKFNSGGPVVQGVDTDVMLSLQFTALLDSTDSALKITRSP